MKDKLLNFLSAVNYSLRSTLCFFIGIHDFEYYKEVHKCTGIKRLNEIGIKIRECTCCGQRWTNGSSSNGLYYDWKRTDIKKDEVLKYKMYE